MRSYNSALLDFCEEALKATGDTRKVRSVTFGPHPLEARIEFEDNTERSVNGLIVSQMKTLIRDSEDV
jgi:hypothetical protein